MFAVTCSEDPHNPIIKESASGAWNEIVKKINEIQLVKKENPSVSGPDKFGLTHPKVVKLIQDLPNADKCLNF